MLRILLAAAVLVAVTALGPLGPRPASAYGTAPWCAVMDIGWENVVSECSYWSFERCVSRVIAGNRGFCEPNPEFREPEERRYRRHPRGRNRR